MCLVESQNICFVETQDMCCVGSLDKKEAFPKSLKREVNIAFDNHFEVTLGGILEAKGAPGAAKVASEAAKCSQGDCQRRLGLTSGGIRHSLRALGEVLPGGGKHLSSLWQGAESKMVSK